ncbi:MAG TPA: hypothetical protein VMD27_04875 [Candidatus Aquilonibacter sp.]|nr:hypothetical protein [Candidatus Aquilonibacter sp.]
MLLVRCQIEMAAGYLSMDDEQAMISERVLNYMSYPDPATQRLLIFSASNHITFFPSDVEYWDKRYPYMHIERRSASLIAGYQMFSRTNSVLNGAKPQPNTALEPTPTAR